MKVRRNFLSLLCLLFVVLPASSFAQSARPRVAILDFGMSPTASMVADTLQSLFHLAATNEFEVMDRDLVMTAARGVGYRGQLNMSRQEARELGSAVGCDFYFLGEAQSLRRSSSARPVYFETYASIFLVSARSGRLILWERPAAEGDSAKESEAQFVAALSTAKTRYLTAARSASESERAERTAAIAGLPIIEVLSEDNTGVDKDIRAPRPYRRLKPAYPDAAAKAQVEATVDALVDLDANGEVGRVEIDRWAGYGLDESVIATVKQMHFFPAMRDGIAIPLRVLLRYNFRKPAPDPAQNRSQ